MTAAAKWNFHPRSCCVKSKMSGKALWVFLLSELCLPSLDFILCACSKRETLTNEPWFHHRVINGYWQKKRKKRKGLRTAPACANPSLNINAFFPQDTNTGAGDICVYMSLSTLCRCTTGKRNLCTYAHLGRLFSTSNLIPRVAPGPLWLPIVLLQASLRHTVLQLPSTAAAMCIQWHRYIIHLFIYCLSKKLTHT